MRNEYGTTNKDDRFLPGEEIEMFDEAYIVIKNYGTRGRVRLLNTTLIIDPFYWEFQGAVARRVKRNAA
jgi:hypothetical protein